MGLLTSGGCFVGWLVESLFPSPFVELAVCLRCQHWYWHGETGEEERQRKGTGREGVQ
jgi:hypothetical protein